MKICEHPQTCHTIHTHGTLWHHATVPPGTTVPPPCHHASVPPCLRATVPLPYLPPPWHCTIMPPCDNKPDTLRYLPPYHTLYGTPCYHTTVRPRTLHTLPPYVIQSVGKTSYDSLNRYFEMKFNYIILRNSKVEQKITYYNEKLMAEGLVLSFNFLGVYIALQCQIYELYDHTTFLDLRTIDIFSEGSIGFLNSG